MSKAGDLVRRAEKFAASAESWADLSNALFDPLEGLLAKAFPTREERAAFVKTTEYERIRQLIRDAIAKYGLVEGATPKKSGRFVVRLPRSLHAALEREAKREGISLNQLIVSKLAVQLGSMVGSGDT